MEEMALSYCYMIMVTCVLGYSSDVFLACTINFNILYSLDLFTGDRRFSAWKGSVVDSVVGVFLTQNVTDQRSR